MGNECIYLFFQNPNALGCRKGPYINSRVPSRWYILITQINIIDLFHFSDKFRASVFDRTKDGSTLMHIAALNGHPETAMVIFNFKKGIN